MASSSSSSSTPTGKYDVFLSFEGETRKYFTDHLYENLCRDGINTFRDDENIRKGENISAELLKAIEGSTMSIIIFSKTYAQSRWCLDELVKILECKKNLQQVVLPIFYKVDPSEVRKQTGEFGKALAQHRQRFDDQKVDEWKVALTTVADLSGLDLQAMTNGYESKFIQKITEEVRRKVNRTHNVTRDLVGIDSRVKDILPLLKTQRHDDIKMFGIFGLGGVGKTTLAKALYNDLMIFQKFEGCCFIANIRAEVSKRYNGLVHLQEKLLCKTLKTENLKIGNVDEGINLIKGRLRSKRVLIVLDDIDDISQLESLAGQRNWFGSGSTIIITTRDVQLLTDLGAQEKYMVETLSPYESLELLSLHAFAAHKPSEEYIELSQRIASYTGGLPLALTIIGSHLRGRSVQEWSDNVEKLRRIPHDKVQNILKISYDALDDDTKNIFLDIAFFFIGHDENDTSIILEACGFYAKIGIKTLIERCLLTIDGCGELGTLQMHDLVRDMGREIVRMESPREPGKRSRLVDPKDVIDVLQGKKGTEAIQGMIVNSSMLKNVPLNIQVFKRMVKLRILILNGMCLSGSFKYLSSELTLFRLHNCHLSIIPSNFRCEKLVELDMQGSNIKEFECNMQPFRCLRTLNLDGCKQLKKTPNFTGAHSLQKVSFNWCLNLVKVHPSIGSLERLVQLEFCYCKKLKVLPRSICKLKSLEVLAITHCQELRELPNDLGKLEKLIYLMASWTAISHIPVSLGCLRNLKSLEMRYYNSCDGVPPSVAKERSWEVIENLKSLEYLNLSGRSYLQSLPFDFCHLSNLKHLYLEDLQNLEVLVELPSDLEILSAHNCVSLKDIAVVSKLKKLKVLNLKDCESLVELPNMESLSSLLELKIVNCNALTIPDNYLREEDLRSLSFSLKEKDLMGRYYLQSLPLSICRQCSNLQILNLDNWQNLRSLPQLPPNLVELSAKNCVSLEKIADLSNLKRLESLDFENCKSLVELSGLESLESLRSLGIANCSGLRIPSIEKWFKAHSEGDWFEILVGVDLRSVFCIFRKWENVMFKISGLSVIDMDPLEIDHSIGIRMSVRSKSRGAWILKDAEYLNIATSNEVYHLNPLVGRIMMGEALEVYAEVHGSQKIFCIAEIHKNREGEVRFFPSTRGCIPSYNMEDGERKRKRKVEIGRGRQRRFLPITRGLIPSVMTLLREDGQRKRKRKVQIGRGGRYIRQRRL